MTPIEYQESEDWKIENSKSEADPFSEKLISKMMAWYRQVFTRDLTIHRFDVFTILILSIVVSIQVMFWVASMDNQIDSAYHFDRTEQILLYFTTGFSVLIGGIIIDILSKRRNVFEYLTGISAFAMVMMWLFPNRLVYVIGMLIVSILGALMTIQVFSLIISKTTLLNRARTVSLIIFVDVIIAAPLITLINTTEIHTWIGFVQVLLLIILLVYGKKQRIAKDVIIGEIKDTEILSFRGYWRIIRKSHMIPYLSFLTLLSATMGFILDETFGLSEENELWITIIVILISFPTIGALLDNIGRKPVVILTIFALGIFIIFFDYPYSDTQATIMVDLRIAVFSFTALLLLIITPVLAGDSASSFSRGRVMGLFLFALIGGIFTGVQIRREFFNSDLTEREIILIADWGISLLFLAVILFSRVSETLDERTPFWRHYLQKLYIINYETGIALYAANFKKIISELNEDLVGGGISGIQSMLKEISESKKNIRVLDHEDLQIIFHYGKHSVAVLFVKSDLVILREKLARFHEMFEYINQASLSVFKGNISRIKDGDLLKRTYFE